MKDIATFIAEVLNGNLSTRTRAAIWTAAIVVASVLGIALCINRRDALYLAIPLAILLIVVHLELHHRSAELHRQALEKAAALHREASEQIAGCVDRSYSQVEA